MNFFKKIFNITERVPVTKNKNWKQGMWVQTQKSQTGILFVLGDTCVVHLVNRTTGETTEILQVPIGELRQAKWGEIPECRRGITKQQAEALGYGT